MNSNYFLRNIIFQFYLFSFIFLWGLFSVIEVNAQTGELFLQNYTLTIANVEPANKAVIQGKDGLMYFANQKGVLYYDGVRWDIIDTQNTPYSLALDSVISQKIYVGGTKSFGYLTEDAWGRKLYTPISDANQRFGAITKIVLNDGYAFFYSDRVVYRVSLRTQKVEKVWIARPNQPFAGIINHKDRIFLQVFGEGLHRIAGDELVSITKAEKQKNVYFNTSIDYDERHTLIGTTSNQLYLFDGQCLNEFPFSLKDYLQENLLTGGINLSKENFALTTLSGGCLLVNKNTGIVNHVINYQTGLLDDEVLALGQDNYGGLWLCTEYGISRVDMNLPLQNFAEYPGIEGKITAVFRQDDILYVGTTVGLFYLEKIERFEQLITIIKEEKEKLTEIQTTIDRTTRITKFEDNDRTGRFLQTIFGNKDKEEKAERAREREVKRQERLNKRNQRRTSKGKDSLQIRGSNSEDDDEQIALSSDIYKEEKPTIIKENRTYSYTPNQMQRNYALQSIPFVYKKVAGVSGKVRQIIGTGKGKVLVASNLGLYAIDGQLARNIIKEKDILFIYSSPKSASQFYIGTQEGFQLIQLRQDTWEVFSGSSDVNEAIFSMALINDVLWLGSENETFKINLNSEGKLIRSQRYKIPHHFQEQVVIRLIQNEPVFFLSSGIYEFDEQKNTFVKSSKFGSYFNPRSPIFFKQEGYTWLRPTALWKNIQATDSTDQLKSNFLSLFSDIEDIYADEDTNLWIITHKGLYRLKAKANPYQGEKFRLFVRSVKDIQGNPLPIQNLTLEYQKTALRIELAAPFYLNEASLEYQYYIEKVSPEWSAWHQESVISFPVLPSGTYKIHFRARNVFGQNSEELIYSFQVKPPYWERWWFYLGGFIALLLGVILLLKIRTQALKAANRRLAQKVDDKTREIAKQKEQLEIAFQEIQKKNKDITSSIRYAQRIQEATLPYENQLTKSFADHFIFYQPKDVVSGDFYWFEEKDGKFIVAVADCTGHGVPGAFMSMIGDSLLNQIVIEKGVTDPASILHNLHLGIVKALKQDNPKNQRTDGMDIVICQIDYQKDTLTFAGANNPLFIVKNNEIQMIRGNRLGIGGLQRGNKVFEQHVLPIDPDAFYYLASDGYTDQFGGPEGKKFMRKRLLNLMARTGSESGDIQKEIFMTSLKEWKGNRRQIDDILVLGFKLSRVVKKE